MSSNNPARNFAPDYKTIYTNFVEGVYGPFDISLLLGESTAGREGLVLTQMAKIVMAPAEAVIVVEVLQNVINSYEETWGKIAKPKFTPQAEAKLAQQLEGKKTESV